MKKSVLNKITKALIIIILFCNNAFAQNGLPILDRT